MYTDIACDSDRKYRDARTHEHKKINKKDKEVKYRRQNNHELDKHESRSELKAEYYFVCKNPEKLAHIVVM